MLILTVNTGSSSVKLDLFLGPAGGSSGELVSVSRSRLSPGEGEVPTELLSRFLASQGSNGEGPRVVAHRVVHGGERLVAPCRVDAGVEAEIGRLAQLAPLHNPVALRWITACRQVLGEDVPQVACFDTAFYAALPEVATTYALPAELSHRLRLRRYGFHGLAHQAMERQWRSRTGARGGRVISLQLGSGCSITAIRDGQALDTSMGFSPLEGLMMATRPGDVDAGLLLHLLGEAGGLTAEALGDLLHHRSGLLGVSDRSSDMRELMAANDPASGRAVELYCYRARKYVGAYLAVLGGVDAVLFGGGVAEHQPEIRRRILEPLAAFGITLDAAANQGARGLAARISGPASAVAVWVLPVDEAGLLAEAAQELMAGP